MGRATCDVKADVSYNVKKKELVLGLINWIIFQGLFKTITNHHAETTFSTLNPVEPLLVTEGGYYSNSHYHCFHL